MKMMNELKPCPFCGSEAVYHEGWSNYIKCSQCKTYLRLDKEDFSSWNNRADLAATKRANIVNGTKACPLCGSFRLLVDIMQRLIFCPTCGLHHGLGSLHDGPVQEILDAWNERSKQ